MDRITISNSDPNIASQLDTLASIMITEEIAQMDLTPPTDGGWESLFGGDPLDVKFNPNSVDYKEYKDTPVFQIIVRERRMAPFRILAGGLRPFFGVYSWSRFFGRITKPILTTSTNNINLMNYDVFVFCSDDGKNMFVAYRTDSTENKHIFDVKYNGNIKDDEQAHDGIKALLSLFNDTKEKTFNIKKLEITDDGNNLDYNTMARIINVIVRLSAIPTELNLDDFGKSLEFTEEDDGRLGLFEMIDPLYVEESDLLAPSVGFVDDDVKTQLNIGDIPRVESQGSSSTMGSAIPYASDFDDSDEGETSVVTAIPYESDFDDSDEGETSFATAIQEPMPPTPIGSDFDDDDDTLYSDNGGTTAKLTIDLADEF